MNKTEYEKLKAVSYDEYNEAVRKNNEANKNSKDYVLMPAIRPDSSLNKNVEKPIEVAKPTITEKVYKPEHPEWAITPGMTREEMFRRNREANKVSNTEVEKKPDTSYRKSWESEESARKRGWKPIENAGERATRLAKEETDKVIESKRVAFDAEGTEAINKLMENARKKRNERDVKENVAGLTKIISKENKKPKESTLKGMTSEEIKQRVFDDAMKVALGEPIDDIKPREKIEFNPFQPIGKKPASGGQKISEGQPIGTYELSRRKEIREADDKKWAETYGPNAKKTKRKFSGPKDWSELG